MHSSRLVGPWLLNKIVSKYGLRNDTICRYFRFSKVLSRKPIITDVNKCLWEIEMAIKLLKIMIILKRCATLNEKPSYYPTIGQKWLHILDYTKFNYSCFVGLSSMLWRWKTYVSFFSKVVILLFFLSMLICGIQPQKTRQPMSPILDVDS